LASVWPACRVIIRSRTARPKRIDPSSPANGLARADRPNGPGTAHHWKITGFTDSTLTSKIQFNNCVKSILKYPFVGGIEYGK
jgi:hypothetical protein